ncbi:hypothetical protein A2U01_0112560, partial [Trifolium medium]|nr:hypothetical protein [Trifolium medium]
MATLSQLSLASE